MFLIIGPLGDRVRVQLFQSLLLVDNVSYSWAILQEPIKVNVSILILTGQCFLSKIVKENEKGLWFQSLF